jgi:hypothetical protein
VPPTPDPGSGQRTVGWVVTGLGAAVLVGGGVVFALGQADFAAFSDGKANREQAQTLLQLYENGSFKSILGVVGLGVGGATIIAGLAIQATASRAPTRKEMKSVKRKPMKSTLFLHKRSLQ